MLKISVLEEPEAVTIKLEGRLGGPWTRELDQTWKILSSSLGGRRLSLDLCDMTYAEKDGRLLLRKIHEKSGAAFITNNPLSKYFAAEAMRTGEEKIEN